VLVPVVSVKMGATSTTLLVEGRYKIAFLALTYKSTLSPFSALVKKGWSASLSLSITVAMVGSSSAGNSIKLPTLAIKIV
jgi:hypothetical protein